MFLNVTETFWPKKTQPSCIHQTFQRKKIWFSCESQFRLRGPEGQVRRQVCMLWPQSSLTLFSPTFIIQRQKTTQGYFVSIYEKQSVHRVCMKSAFLALHHFVGTNAKITKHLACQMVKTNNICTFAPCSYEVIYLRPRIPHHFRDSSQTSP